MNQRANIDRRGAWSVVTLLRRFLAVIYGDRIGLLLFIFQPAIIAGLICLVSAHDHSIPKKLFLGSIACSWLGCSNAAQIIVRERAIFLRERLAGLRLHSYILSKFIGMGLLSCIQTLFVYAILYYSGNGLVGSVWIQIVAMLSGSVMLTAIGIYISAASRSVTQAILTVPIVIIPQILFCGFVFPLEIWTEKPATMLISRLSPSYSTQKMIDISLFWDKEIDYDYLDKYRIESPNLENLRIALVPASVWLFGSRESYSITAEEQGRFYSSVNLKKPLKEQVIDPGQSFPKYRIGSNYQFHHVEAFHFPLISVVVWVIISYCAAWIALIRA